MYLEIAKLSKIGRRKVNEDACDYWLSSNLSCCVLSDGLGGHYGGDVASQLVISSIGVRFVQQPQCSAKTIELLLNEADGAIVREQQKNTRLKEMRATAVLLLIDTINHIATWGHIGDSRLYCFRDGRISAQTRDHSISQNMVEAGYLKPSELRSSPTRNQLYAALGDGDASVMDILQQEFPIMYGDVFLMCSDGLWECIEEHEMESTLHSSSSASEWLSTLEKQVLLRGSPTQDNYSAIVVWCKDSDDERTLMPGELN
ncbi:MAG TPA: serine/threonine-protein phosphatase [Nitrosomonas sp.]|nr:serine/threonine-protein phosphatase [Nitrosomonas sp.]